MKRFIIKRLLTSIPLIFIILTINFFIIHMAPGDPVKILVSSQEALGLPPEYLDTIRADYGLDKPLHEQLIIYIKKIVLEGDLGYSFFTKEPISKTILRRLPHTILLMGLSLIISVLLGIFLGMTSASDTYSKKDFLITIFSLILWSIPFFWMGMIALLFFAFYIPIFPVGGSISIGVTGSLNLILDRIWHLMLPLTCLVLGTTALYTRFTRSSLTEVLSQDYITTAYSKGCSKGRVLRYHAFRNAALSIVTLIGLRIRGVFMGSVLVETIFAWPGLGSLLYYSIKVRDYNVILGMFFIYSILTIVCNIITDVSYSLIDPRIRYGEPSV